MKKYLGLSLAAISVIAQAGPANAVTPLSYSMVNGNTGSYEYWDETYNGAGCNTCSNAALSGGLGELNDGIVATQNWYVTEAPTGNGGYVGWTIDPTITFNFAPGTAIGSISIAFDDSDGAGGVSAPSSFIVNGVNYAVTEPAGSAPSFFTLSNLGFVGSTFTVTAIRKNQWLMLSEVSFAAPGAVPEPATWAMMMLGFGTAGYSLRSRRRVAPQLA